MSQLPLEDTRNNKFQLIQIRIIKCKIVGTYTYTYVHDANEDGHNLKNLNFVTDVVALDTDVLVVLV